MKLEPATAPPRQPNWVRSHATGLTTFVVGLAALTTTAAVHFGGDGELAKIPDIRLTIPFLVATLTFFVAALVRREGAYALPITGLALAVSACVIGWALVLGVVAAATALAVLLLSEVL